MGEPPPEMQADPEKDIGHYSGEHDKELALALAYYWWRQRINERGGFLSVRERQAFGEVTDMGAEWMLSSKRIEWDDPEKIIYHALRGDEDE